MSIPRTAIQLSAVALSAVLLTGCGGGTPEPGFPAPTPVLTAESTPEPTSSPVDEEPAVDVRASIVDAISSGSTAALHDLLDSPVYMKYAASEVAGDISDRDRVIDNLTAVTSGGGVWDFDLPASLIENYRNNPGSAGAYVEDFPADALVGRSSDDKVLSFTIVDGLITRILVANTEYALIYE